MASPGNLIGFVPITDAERARTFYVDTLGLHFVSDDGFALVLKSGENMVRLVKMPSVTPAQFTILGWEATDIVQKVTDLTAAGVPFQRYSFLQQDELGIWTAPSGDRIAWLTDPDGNVLSLSQHV